MSIREKVLKLMGERTRVTMYFTPRDARYEGMRVMHFLHAHDDNILVRFGVAGRPKTICIRRDKKFVWMDDRHTEVSRPLVDVLAAFIRGGPDQVALNLIDQIDDMLGSRGLNASLGVFAQLTFPQMNGCKIASSCDIYRKDYDYTAFLTPVDGEEFVVYFTPRRDTIRGYVAVGAIRELELLMQTAEMHDANYLYRHRTLRFPRGIEDWKTPCSRFYFVRRWGEDAWPVPENVRRYIADERLFIVSPAVRTQVLELTGMRRYLGNKNAFVHITRLLPKEENM